MRNLILFFLIMSTLNGCSQDFGPGYRFDLFKNTVNWKLALAIEKDDVNELKHNLVGISKARINLQEPIHGQTLLNLAIGNDKLDMVKTLLEYGASLTIPNSLGFTPIHEVCVTIGSRQYSAEILKTLLEHGADPNSIALLRDGNFSNDVSKYLPLMGAIKSLECTKILLDHGANLYYKDSLDYPIWEILLGYDIKNSESISIAKYLIIDKKMMVPKPIFFTIPDAQPKDAIYMLQKFETFNDPKKEKIRQEILNYLKINY